MPQVWIAIFFILLAVAQLYQSLKDIDLPLPIYLILGVVLAIASNSQQQFSFSQTRTSTYPTIDGSHSVLSLVQTPVLADDKLGVDSVTPLENQ
jgi:hypothetical protein